MLLSVSIRSILLTLLALPLGLALECTLSNALNYSPPSTSGTGTGTGGFELGDVCDRLCNTETCFQLCRGKKLKARATLDCTDTESCFLNPTDKSLLCLNRATGAYRDDDGGNGNVLEGVYTAADGQATTVSVTRSLSSTAATATSSGLGTPASTSLISSTPSVSASQSSVLVNPASTPTTGVAPTTPSPTSGVERMGGRTSAYGIMGLVVGLLLA